MAILADCVWRLSNRLINLSLNFAYCSNLTSIGLQTLSKEFKSLSRGLNHLKLDFSNCVKLTDIGLGYLGEGVSNLTGLRQLDLEFSFCPLLTNLGLKNLADSIPALLSLTSLTLGVFNCLKLTDLGLGGYLGERISVLRNSLTSLCLDLSHTRITSFGVISLSKSLSKLSLNTFSLDLHGCDVTDGVVTAIVDSLWK